MARRSPTNPRYQKHTAAPGRTRRSASSAKLKRTGAGSARRKERSRFAMPPATPEMKRWRRIWWALIGFALLSALSILIPGVKENRLISYVVLGVETAALLVAVYIDWKIIRPLRAEAYEQARRERKSKG